MTDKTMPERIWAWEDDDGFRDFDNMAGWKENGIESDFDGAEYVRADLVSGDASEPLASGQYRWVKHYDWPYWELGQVVQQNAESDSLEVVLEDIIVDIECLQKIGPVIRPPEDE